MKRENPRSTFGPEAEKLIPLYLDKWRSIAISTKPIHRPTASLVIKQIYSSLGRPHPDIHFFESPLAALSFSLQSGSSQGGNSLAPQVRDNLFSELYNHLRDQVTSELENKIYQSLYNPIYYQVSEPIHRYLIQELCEEFAWGETNLFSAFELPCDFLFPDFLACQGSWIDFGISVLKLEYDREKWEIFQSLIDTCGWIYPTADSCWVCDRPRQLRLNARQQLHAEGELAVEFADRWGIYAYRGVRLPKAYGRVNPQQWQPQWLLTEANAEIRRVLIQGIGYSKICQELGAIELDSWQEYSLLKIENLDREPIHLLKMTCPSTASVHILRVPPNITLAREAIRWIDWDIDPTEFSVQT